MDRIHAEDNAITDAHFQQMRERSAKRAANPTTFLPIPTMPPRPEPPDIDVLVWYPIQSFLTAAANVSKGLWGQGGDHPDRVQRRKNREPLRQLLKVADDSPLRNVNMRNKFDHFDEKIDEWWEQSTQHLFIDGNLMALDGIKGGEKIDAFRSFDRNRFVVGFWGTVYDLRQIEKAIGRLKGETVKHLP